MSRRTAEQHRAIRFLCQGQPEGSEIEPDEATLAHFVGAGESKAAQEAREYEAAFDQPRWRRRVRVWSVVWRTAFLLCGISRWGDLLRRIPALILGNPTEGGHNRGPQRFSGLAPFCVLA